MKILNVPFVSQSSSSNCLLAALEMVFLYYRKQISQDQVAKEVSPIPDDNEYHIADLGSYAIKQGFKVSIFCYDFTNIFSASHENVLHNQLLKKFTHWIRESKKNLKYRMPYLHFLEQDGNLYVSLPSSSTLEHCIDKDIPPIILVEAKPFFGDVAAKDAGHSVIVIGYDKNSFYIHDPLNPTLPHAKGKSVKIPKDKLLYCWYRRYGNTLIVES